MKRLPVNYSKGQIKIQQMAFVLVGFMILFGIVALFYVSLKTASLKESATEIRHDQARELVRKLAGSPELRSDECPSCVDLDKVFVITERPSYQGFWGNNIAFLKIKKIYPVNGTREVECENRNYPACNTITLIDTNSTYVSEEAFVSICRYEGTQRYTKCELGKVIMGVIGA